MPPNRRRDGGPETSRRLIAAVASLELASLLEPSPSERWRYERGCTTPGDALDSWARPQSADTVSPRNQKGGDEMDDRNRDNRKAMALDHRDFLTLGRGLAVATWFPSTARAPQPTSPGEPGIGRACRGDGPPHALTGKAWGAAPARSAQPSETTTLASAMKTHPRQRNRLAGLQDRPRSWAPLGEDR